MAFERRRALGGTIVWISMLLLVGCLSSPDGAIHDPGLIDPPPNTEQALFLLQREDLRSSDWPHLFDDYSLVVCNPSLFASDLNQIRADIPGVICLAYTSVQDIPIGTHVGNPYYDALTAAFDEDYCIRDLNTGETVCIYGHGTPNAVPAWIVRQESIDALVAFHRNVTITAGWDGFYIDQCTRAYPNSRKMILQEITDSFDIDDDQIPDTVEYLSQRYEYCRPKLTLAMRQEFPDKILVGNSGGRLDDPRLNGITLEGVGDRFTLDQARSFYNSQKAVATLPYHAVAWRTTDESSEGCRVIAQELGIYYGVVASHPEGGALRKPSLKRMVPDH